MEEIRPVRTVAGTIMKLIFALGRPRAGSRLGKRRFRSLLLLASAVAAVALISGSLAGAASLAPQGCIDDNDTGADECAQSTDGLDGATTAAMSPDGRSVYVAGAYDDAIVRFGRGVDGSLTPQGCVDDNSSSAGEDNCAQSTPGLYGVRSVAVSPDGKSLYAASYIDDAIVRFDRNTSNGALTPQGCIDNAELGATCAQHADGLLGADSVTVSPDGKSVYVASASGHAVARFNRDASTGAISPAGCVADDDNGDTGCSQSTAGLDGATFVTVSPDGKSVYAASEYDSAIVRLDRDTTTGAITAGGCVDDNDTGDDACAQTTDGLGGVESVAVSPDGKSLYAAAGGDWDIARFDRNTSSGALTPQGCIEAYSGECAQSATGLSHASDVTVSPDGSAVYVSAWTSDAVVSFARDADSGALVPAGCIGDSDSGPSGCAEKANGLDGANSVVTSPTGESVYVASFWDDAVARLSLTPGTPPVPSDEIETDAELPLSTRIDPKTGAWIFASLTGVGQLPGRCMPLDVSFPIESGGGSVSNASLILVPRNGANSSVAMSNPSGNTWTGTIPCFATGNLYLRYDLSGAGGTQTFVVALGGLVLIDPQGVVYDKAAFDVARANGKSAAEARSEAAISGATVWLQRSSGGTFADLSPTDPGIAPQINPEVTGADGIYQWDVAAGTYRVRASKAGYRAATSPAVVIPPPVTDLHVALADTSVPETKITSGPKAKTRSHKATFKFRSTDPGSTFECKLDKASYKRCSSPQTYKTKQLKHGSHKFSVRATDPVGNTDATPAKESWKIKR